ncbi:MAG: universal stress protein, partial [bacterium]|nr:universal stress protein [bacterium]
AALGLPVLAYHTTWRNPRSTSDQPEDHMVGNARALLRTLIERAAFHGVPFRAIVACADSVAEGIIRTAQRERCSAIVTARGLHTGRGSYADQLLTESPVPIIVVPRRTEVSR